NVESNSLPVTSREPSPGIVTGLLACAVLGLMSRRDSVGPPYRSLVMRSTSPVAGAAVAGVAATIEAVNARASTTTSVADLFLRVKILLQNRQRQSTRRQN